MKVNLVFFFDEHICRNNEQKNIPINKLMENCNLAKNDKLNIAGLLLFGKQTQNYLPSAYIKIMYFNENKIEDDYIEKIEAKVSLDEQFQNLLVF